MHFFLQRDFFVIKESKLREDGENAGTIFYLARAGLQDDDPTDDITPKPKFTPADNNATKSKINITKRTVPAKNKLQGTVDENAAEYAQDL